jgi:hypothetical protein
MKHSITEATEVAKFLAEVNKDVKIVLPKKRKK